MEEEMDGEVDKLIHGWTGGCMHAWMRRWILHIWKKPQGRMVSAEPLTYAAKSGNPVLLLQLFIKKYRVA